MDYIAIKPRGSQKEGNQVTASPIKQTETKSMTLRYTQSKEKTQREERKIHVHMHQLPSETK